MLKNFFKAGFGVIGSQAINLLSLPIISRLYTPEAYAIWAIVIATATIFGSIACFRYELAIVIAKDENEASLVFWWCVLSTIGMGLLVLLVAQIPWFQKFILPEDINNEWYYTFFAPLLIITMGFTFALQYWNIRQQNFMLNSFAMIAVAGITLLVQSIWAIKYSASSVGLLIGSLCGQFVAVFWLIIGTFFINKLPKISKHIFKEIPYILSKHRRFLFYSTPYTIFGIARARASVLVLENFLTSEDIGLYAFAYRILNFPVSLISEGPRTVLFQESASRGVELLEDKINQILRWLAIITIPFVIFYFFYAQELFILFFGEKWARAGYIGKFLILPVFTFLFCNWMDRIMDVLGMQRLVLILEIIFSTLSIGGLWLGFILKMGLNGALVIQCIVLIIYNIIYLYIVYDKAGYNKNKLYKLLYYSVILTSLWGLLLSILKGLFSDIYAILLYFFILIVWLSLVSKSITTKIFDKGIRNDKDISI